MNFSRKRVAKGKSQVSEEEVKKALKKFQDKGGLIKKLPDEVAPRSTLVGAKWGMFEGGGEKSGGVDPS